jgi:hypothetical protein
MGIVGPFGDHPFCTQSKASGRFVFMKFLLHPVGVYRRAKETWKGGSLKQGVYSK